jgi:hypothetical protein
MVFDIAEMLFREILGMSTYPGSPFTGDIFRDIILFFFVPTVFLIIFVYMLSGLVIPPAVHKLRLLMAIAIYAFIIASRYFEGFAIFASQFYFVFVIFVGILYFISTHFRRAGRGGGMAYEGGGGGGGMPYEGHGRDVKPRFGEPHNLNTEQLKKVIIQLERMDVARQGRDPRIGTELAMYQAELTERENRFRLSPRQFM